MKFTSGYSGGPGPAPRGLAFSESFTGTPGFANSVGGASAPSALANAPQYKLFDANSVMLATFLGTPLGGSFLMSLNYRRMHKALAAAGTLLLGIAITGGAILAAYLIPQSASYVISIGLLFGMKALAQSMQGEAVNQHEVQGGRLASKWAAAGIGLATLAVLFLGIVGVLFAQALASSVTVGKYDIQFSGVATRQEAHKLGQALQSAGYPQDHRSTILFSKTKEGTTSVGFVVADGIWSHPEMVTAFENFARQVAPAVGGFPIQVQLLDTQKEAQKDLNVGRAAVGKDEVFYYGEATDADGTALAQQLKTIGFFDNSGASVFLSKGDDGTAISFVVREGIWEQPDKVAIFQHVVRDCAPAVGGLPVKLRFLTATTELRKEIVVQ